MKQGIWLLPTKDRIGKLTRFFTEARKTDLSTPGLVLVQRDELVRLWHEYRMIDLPPGWALWPTEADGLGDKLRELWPAYSKLDWAGILVDDLVPYSIGWDRSMIDGLNGTNFVTCDDAEQAPTRMASASVWSGELLRAVGYLMPEGLWHCYHDNVWEDLGIECGCWYVNMAVLVRHEHPFKLPDELDATHEASYGRMHDDEDVYLRWRETDRDAAIERIKALQATLPPVEPS